ATPQARDCFSDLGLSFWQWTTFFVLTFLWAWTVHIAARRAVLADDWVPEARCGELTDTRREELRAEYEWPALLVPRLLGLMVFVFVLVALVRARANLVTAEDVLIEAHDAVVLSWWLEGATIFVALVYILMIWTRRQFRSAIMGSDAPQPVEPALLMGVRPFPLSMFANRRAPKLSPILSAIDIVTVLFGIGITFFFAIAFVLPHWVADLLPRVMIVALLFGGVVLMLGEVALWSTRLQTPFLLILMVLVAVCLYIVDAFHDVRYFEASAPPSKARGTEPQVPLTEAVRRWKAVNGCGAEGQTCPRPILIAGAGGASRAAFMTATVVGAIIDLGLAEPEKYGNVRNRIFAMSTVSGSSLGAVVMRAALTDAA